MFTLVDWLARLEMRPVRPSDRRDDPWRVGSPVNIILYRWCTKCLCMYIYVVTRYLLHEIYIYIYIFIFI